MLHTFNNMENIERNIYIYNIKYQYSHGAKKKIK